MIQWLNDKINDQMVNVQIVNNLHVPLGNYSFA